MFIENHVLRSAVGIQTYLHLKLSLTLFRFDIVEDSLSESLVSHKVLVLIQAMISVGSRQKLFFLEHVRNIWVVHLSVANFLVTSRLISIP